MLYDGFVYKKTYWIRTVVNEYNIETPSTRLRVDYLPIMVSSKCYNPSKHFISGVKLQHLVAITLYASPREMSPFAFI